MLKVVKNEWRLIRRDSMLFMMPFFIVYMGVVLHFLMPWLTEYLSSNNLMPGNVSQYRFDYYYPLVMYYMVIITGPQIAGTVFAVLILSDKDDETIKALMVSPLTIKQYIRQRVILAWATGVLFTLALFYMINIGMLPFWQLLLIAAGGGFTATLITLGLSLFAKNKVQGMSYAKSISFIALVILASWFVKGNLQLLFGIIPAFWVCKSYTLALENDLLWLLYLGIGILYQAGFAYYLLKLFNKRIYKMI